MLGSGRVILNIYISLYCWPLFVMGGNLSGGLVENGWDERGVGESLFGDMEGGKHVKQAKPV